MKSFIIALLLIATVPATALDFGGPSRTINLYDKDKKEVIARATISRQRIYFHTLEGKHFATIARNPDNTIGAWDPNGKPIDPTVLPSLPRE
jgi:hypothetical protein